jgi:ferrous iron transport protein A
MDSQPHNFAQLSVGDRAIILAFLEGPPAYRRRLMSLGLTPGTAFSVVKVAPLGDPVEIEVRGFRLSLRRSEAACIEVTKV